MSEIPEKQIKRLRSLIQEAETNLSAAKELLISVLGDGEAITAPRDVVVSAPEGKVIEGVFDGQIMIDQEGKNYPVPANYASKSKLVEGDIMKLTITPEGKFLYKQIGPVERKTVIGTLTHHDDKYFVEVAGKEYIIFTVDYESGISNIYNNYRLCVKKHPGEQARLKFKDRCLKNSILDENMKRWIACCKSR